jgi:hypothetical protein
VSTGIDKYLNDIKVKILANNDLCRLLYYNDDNPLSMPNLPDTSILYRDKLNQKLFFTPFVDDSDSEAKSTLNVVVNNFKLDPATKYFKDISIDFIVMIHNNLWILDDGSGEIKLRANAIWKEINNTFFDHRTAMGKNLFDYCKMVRTKDGLYSGYVFCSTATDLPLLQSAN